MIVGDTAVLAIESNITAAYEHLGLRALGCFVIHVGGRRFGAYEPDASMLACSFDEVQKRIADRGKHNAAFATEPAAGKIADSFRHAIYADEQNESYFGMPRAEFASLFDRNLTDLMWTPDGDEAFDDGSYILQFDVDHRVRVIAFKSGEDSGYDPDTLRDIWLPADNFYRILDQWRNAFEREWMAREKVPHNDSNFDNRKDSGDG